MLRRPPSRSPRLRRRSATSRARRPERTRRATSLAHWSACGDAGRVSSPAGTALAARCSTRPWRSWSSTTLAGTSCGLYSARSSCDALWAKSERPRKRKRWPRSAASHHFWIALRRSSSRRATTRTSPATSQATVRPRPFCQTNRSPGLMLLGRMIILPSRTILLTSRRPSFVVRQDSRYPV